MRKVALETVDGITRIVLNNQPIFQIGPLDQGLWPEGIHAAPTNEALKYDLEMTRRFGWNMVRKHIKVEPDRWYYWADKLGVLVWQDMPSADADNLIPAPADDFEPELRAMIAGRYNHPSIVLRIVINEGWGQAQFGPLAIGRCVNLVKSLDPSRLVGDQCLGLDRLWRRRYLRPSHLCRPEFAASRGQSCRRAGRVWRPGLAYTGSPVGH
ncbi:MAG TPA: hypothetical protein VMT34_00570 [Aggregatilineales bacterium]|nr:hypothetical protein [Aggregatilineales bacterium]